MAARVVIGDEQSNLTLTSRGSFKDVGHQVDGSFAVKGIQGAFSTILNVPHLALARLEAMHTDLCGVVELGGASQSIELRVKLAAQKLGHIDVEAWLFDFGPIDIKIGFKMDQTYLLPLINQWRTAFPAPQ